MILIGTFSVIRKAILKNNDFTIVAVLLLDKISIEIQQISCIKNTYVKTDIDLSEIQYCIGIENI